MPIRRAGPFASSTDSFLNEPATPALFTEPVNCALDFSASTWPWRHYKRVITNNVTTQTYENGAVDVDESIGGIFSTQAVTTFYYQATEDAEMTVTYNFSASNDPGLSSNVSFDVFVDGSPELELSDSGQGSIGFDGSTSITLPEAVVPIRVVLSGFCSPSGGGNMEFSISA